MLLIKTTIMKTENRLLTLAVLELVEVNAWAAFNDF